MTLSWIECKVTYERAGEKGLNTKVNEVYLTQGFTFTEVEKRITMELQPQVTGTFDINKMERQMRQAARMIFPQNSPVANISMVLRK